LSTVGRIRKELATQVPGLWAELTELAEEWAAPVLLRLAIDGTDRGFPKTFNDPIWGVIELYPHEVLLLDSPILQPLRGVRQLGMAQLVYPSASHDRLEHTRGVVEAADRMIRALARNAAHRARYGDDRDEHVPPPTELDITSIRLAGLLHDLGHGPFSHATEEVLRGRLSAEFKHAETILRAAFDGTTKIATSETIAVLVVLSEPMGQIFGHPNFNANVPANRLPMAIAARILGSRTELSAQYLSGVISGPVDADKLDYMARDCHHAGLPLGLDINRLISKLEVVTITETNAINPELAKRAGNAPTKRIYEMGISLAGLGAYEQMIIGRVILYDRLYHHHKVRAAETMVRRLIALAEAERGKLFSIKEMLLNLSDDTFLAVLAGDLISAQLPVGNAASQGIAKALQNREIYHRAYAFAARFLALPEGLPEADQGPTRAWQWRQIYTSMIRPEQLMALSDRVVKKAKELGEAIPALRAMSTSISDEHVIIDLPLNKAIVRGGDILTRTSSGDIGRPNLFFDPERWSKAYEEQKQIGFVFAPRNVIPLITMAARIVFFEEFEVVMTSEADRASKTSELIQSAWWATARSAGVITEACAEILADDKPRMAVLRAEEIKIPLAWQTAEPAARETLARALREALPAGLPASKLQAVVDAIEHLSHFVQMLEETKGFVGQASLDESELQEKLKSHLVSRGAIVQEGTELAGGETDLILAGGLAVENKVNRDKIANPLLVKANYNWQCRRYNIATNSRIGVVVMAYRPANEAAILPLWQRIEITGLAGAPEDRAQVRVVIPWGHSTPHEAKSPG
jgi:HD superfamily phosphohydrolase